MIEEIMTIWRELPQKIQITIFDISKLGLLIIITLVCIKKLKKWFIDSGLDSCFKLSFLEQDKTTVATNWLSTGLAYGLCITLAIVVLSIFIVEENFLSSDQVEILVKLWGSCLFYLLLMCLFKQALDVFSELLKSPAIESHIEHFFGYAQNNQPYKHTDPITPKVIHYATSTLYYCVSWLVGFMLVIDVLDLQLFSGLAQGFLLSSGNLIIALLMLFFGFKLYTHQRTEGNISLLHNKQSALIIASSVLLGSLIIGGSSNIFSILPWLFLFAMLGCFLIKYETGPFSDLIAGIFLRLKIITSLNADVQNENNHLRITKLGILVSEVSHSSGEQENINNSKLLSINPEKNAN